MPLRSDFKISAATPETPAIDTGEKPPFTEQDYRDLASQLKELGIKDSRFKGIHLDVQHPARQAEPTRESPAPAHRVAFLVTHGMGQQVPFETLSMIGQALITEHSKRHPAAKDAVDFDVQVRRVRLTSADDAPELSRVEVTLPPRGDKPVEAHIYESYWAPFTEGQISFLQTVAFLYSAAWNGIKTYIKAWWRESKQPQGSGSNANANVSSDPSERSAKTSDGLLHFDRWMFGKFHDMAIKPFTPLLLIGALVLVSLLLAPALLIFTSFGLSQVKQIVTTHGIHFLHWPHILQAAILIAVPLFFALALAVHYFVVEFVGDVAIYVSSYKVSRFDAIRDKILQEACSVARQIYSAGIFDKTELPYDSVVIVGHSLGSVISYDTLNSCINWDQVDCNFERRVVARTTRFITFGSPLDKTAFLFRTQVSSARNLREALAARQQPLILDYEKFRPLATFRWINIHAPADIISGHLDYYDPKDATGLRNINPVDNVVDPEATTPLLAHVEYWDNSMLHEKLYDAAWAAIPVH